MGDGVDPPSPRATVKTTPLIPAACAAAREANVTDAEAAAVDVVSAPVSATGNEPAWRAVLPSATCAVPLGQATFGI